MEKTCEQCENNFNTNKKRKRFCDACALERTRACKRKYSKKHFRENREYYRKYYGHKKYFSKLNNVIKRKLNNYKTSDKKYGRGFTMPNYVTVDFIKEALKKCNNRCTYCNKILKLKQFKKQDPDMFTLDRINNALAHTKTNICIACNQCNHKKHTKDFTDFTFKKLCEFIKKHIN